MQKGFRQVRRQGAHRLGTRVTPDRLGDVERVGEQGHGQVRGQRGQSGRSVVVGWSLPHGGHLCGQVVAGIRRCRGGKGGGEVGAFVRVADAYPGGDVRQR